MEDEPHDSQRNGTRTSTANLTSSASTIFAAPRKGVRRAWLPILAKGEIIKGVSNGVKDAGKYEEWISAEILNLIVTYTGKCASKTTPVMVEVPVDTATLEVEELKLVGVDKVKDGDATVTVNAIYRYTSKATLHNLPQLLIDAAVQLDFGHEKTIRTALTLYSKKLISYPLVQQNCIPQEVWRMMLRNRKVLRHNPKWGKSVKLGGLSKRHNFSGTESVYHGFGIITTGLHPTDLTRDEERLYNLIVKRVCLMPSALQRDTAGISATRENTRKPLDRHIY